MSTYLTPSLTLISEAEFTFKLKQILNFYLKLKAKKGDNNKKNQSFCKSINLRESLNIFQYNAPVFSMSSFLNIWYEWRCELL